MSWPYASTPVGPTCGTFEGSGSETGAGDRGESGAGPEVFGLLSMMT